MKGQENIFGLEKITVGECINLTIESLQEYGARHKHWAMAWSWGKDSTTLVTLIIQLIKTGQIQAPETLTVFAADTRLELTPLWLSAQVLKKQMEDCGVRVEIVRAPLDKRFLVYILGRGVPPPNNGTLRWCTRQIKIEPMNEAVQQFISEKAGDVLMLTGVRLGESAVRDSRINVSCSKDGGECGQGWYQNDFQKKIATLAPILHWRVCNVWDWLKYFAPLPKYGKWNTTMLAEAYGGDEAEENNTRTGCLGCPLVDKDTALDALVQKPNWAYLAPLKGLKVIYREMRLPIHRKRKSGGEKRKDGSLSKNQQRMGPLELESRLHFLDRILEIQSQVNTTAREQERPEIDILNPEEEARIRELIALKTFPDKWDGTEVNGAVAQDVHYADGSIMKRLFYE
jgi:DNA sulfur modification protein DndC